MSNTDLGSLREEVSAKRVRQEIVLSNRVLRVPKIAGKCQNLNMWPYVGNYVCTGGPKLELMLMVWAI